MFKIIFIFIIFFYHANANDKSELIIHKVPKSIKISNVYDSKDNIVDIFDEKKKFTILNFWATWCAPCVKEIPDLLNIQSVQKEKFNVFFVSVGFTSPEDIKKFKEKHKFKNMKVLYDKNLKFSKDLEVSTIPTTIIIDNKQKEIIKATGYIDWNAKKKIELLENL